jgi:hypothetical protein
MLSGMARFLAATTGDNGIAQCSTRALYHLVTGHAARTMNGFGTLGSGYTTLEAWSRARRSGGTTRHGESASVHHA